MSSSDQVQQMPLKGMQVLDLGRHLAGPTGAMWLGDLGADVIKVESLEAGDPGRAAGPPFFQGESAFFLAANRNKRSLALNLKVEEGQRLFRRLARTSDVVIENFRPGVMEALNIGYERVSQSNPRIIYGSISGYGPTGPMAHRPGLDQIIQGFSGLMSVTGFEESDPVRVGIPVADLVAGLFCAYGILAALQAREKTGRGQQVSTSLLESMVGMMSFQALRFLNGGDVPPQAGNHHPIIAPYGVFKARDGLLTIGTTDEKSWQRLCRAIDAPELLEDARFQDNGSRFQFHDELAGLLSQKLQKGTVEEWEQRLTDASIPCGPVHTIEQALNHPQLSSRRMIVEMEHPSAGTVRLLGLPVKLSHTPGRIRHPPPLLGQHTREVLREIGVSPGELEDLEKVGVIGMVTGETRG